MPITLERVTTIHPPGEQPSDSHWGYIIPEDGTVYALAYRYYHGVVLAMLYPDKLKDFRSDRCPEGLTIPDRRDDIDVFAFQDFELEQHGELPAIRICPSRSLAPSFDFPKGGVTKAQVEALRLCIKAMCMSARDKVQTDIREMRVCDIWGYLTILGDDGDLKDEAVDGLEVDPWPALEIEVDENDVPDDDDVPASDGDPDIYDPDEDGDDQF